MILGAPPLTCLGASTCGWSVSAESPRALVGFIMKPWSPTTTPGTSGQGVEWGQPARGAPSPRAVAQPSPTWLQDLDAEGCRGVPRAGLAGWSQARHPGHLPAQPDAPRQLVRDVDTEAESITFPTSETAELPVFLWGMKEPLWLFLDPFLHWSPHLNLLLGNYVSISALFSVSLVSFGKWA